jgi:hypothetical protein
MPWLTYWIKRFFAMLKGWRTMLVNLILSILPILQLTELMAIMPDKYLPYYALVMALANMWMRKITTTPLGQSKKDQ